MAAFMDLSRLTASRTSDPVSPLEIPERALCDRFQRTYTGAINDVLREFNMMNQTLPIAIRPLRAGMVTTGIAFTIRSAREPAISLEAEMGERAKLLEAIPENAVCVWDTGQDDSCAHWGGMMTAAVKKRGVRGAIIDGGMSPSAIVEKGGYF